MSLNAKGSAQSSPACLPASSGAGGPGGQITPPAVCTEVLFEAMGELGPDGERLLVFDLAAWY